jgi:hypothetical protein
MLLCADVPLISQDGDASPASGGHGVEPGDAGGRRRGGGGGGGGDGDIPVPPGTSAAAPARGRVPLTSMTFPGGWFSMRARVSTEGLSGMQESGGGGRGGGGGGQDLVMSEVMITGAEDSFPRTLASIRGGIPRARGAGGGDGESGIGGGGVGTNPRGVSGLSPEMQSVGRWAETCVPFVLLLAVVFIYEHGRGILIFAWLTIFLAQASFPKPRSTRTPDPANPANPANHRAMNHHIRSAGCNNRASSCPVICLLCRRFKSV